MPTKVAIIQKPPILLDRDGTMGVALTTINEAADAGASLMIFPEAEPLQGRDRGDHGGHV